MWQKPISCKRCGTHVAGRAREARDGVGVWRRGRVRAARLDKLKLERLVHRLEFDDPEEGADHVEAAVAFYPHRLDDAVCGLEVRLNARVQRLLDEQRMRLVAHLRAAGRARQAIGRRPRHHAARGGAPGLSGG